MNQSIVVEEPTANAGANPQGTAQTKPPADDLPEKYRGKELKDIIAMHAEAEKRIGTLRDEVGQWRSLTETLAQTKAETPANKTPETPLSEDDFFKSPIEATRKLIEQTISDRLGKVEAEVSQVNAATEFEKFQKDYPEFDSKVRSDEFRGWALRSQGRMADAAAAAKGDMRAARRLMEDWTEIEALSGGSRQETTEQPQDSGIEAARAASTDTGARRSAPVSKAQFSRAEIVDMIVKNPSKYESMQTEIQQAIREGRVSGF